LWDDGAMIDLNSFVPPGSGLQLVEAVAINDRGEIAGDLVPPDCGGGIVPTQGNDAQCGHAFVLVPCDVEAIDSESCLEAEAASKTVDENRGAPTMPITAAHPQLTAKEMRERFRSLLINRNRRFRSLPTN
jgi:hypothetical protein